ncbi:uncharacterized protein LOC123218488 isoform X1 [Mangifera indica]|uniref:uncharacterized protein LOC123218488 isoform X1 n=1 Tax=Mangifera indica TaxID=29780 RepID=UPI001CF9B235|nr:uncharacterized protein LOC123218488 isoform X1 [Mangifera indica]XP_044495888.1 uncharacterized protein LOC123218488 isoform X1 [Mangifera indica]
MNPMSEETKDHVRYRKFYKALQENDWESVDDYITQNPDALTAIIKVHWQETIFHIITRKLGTPLWLIKRLVSKIPPERLEQLTDRYGGTALFCAASFRNTQAAKAFVGSNKNLPNVPNFKGYLPIHRAAACGHKEMIQYLLEVTTAPLNDEKGVPLFKSLISSGLYGSAYDLLKKYPGLISKTKDRGSILEVLANKPLAFQSGSRFGYWRRLIYNRIPLPEKHIRYPENGHGDEENQIKGSKKCKKFTCFGSICRQIFTAFGASGNRLHIMLWNALADLVPGVKNIRDTKLMHMQTLEIVRMMCHDGVIWSKEEACQSLCDPILTAASLGICEIVREILKAYFYSYAFKNASGHASSCNFTSPRKCF